MLHYGVEEKVRYQMVRDFDCIDDEDPTRLLEVFPYINKKSTMNTRFTVLFCNFFYIYNAIYFSRSFNDYRLNVGISTVLRHVSSCFSRKTTSLSAYFEPPLFHVNFYRIIPYCIDSLAAIAALKADTLRHKDYLFHKNAMDNEPLPRSFQSPPGDQPQFLPAQHLRQ